MPHSKLYRYVFLPVINHCNLCFGRFSIFHSVTCAKQLCLVTGWFVVGHPLLQPGFDPRSGHLGFCGGIRVGFLQVL
jgi:hypothetical protein